MKILDILQREGTLLEGVSQNEVIPKLGKEVLITYSKSETLAGGKKNEHQGRITKVTRNLPVYFTKPGEYEQRMKEMGHDDYVAQASRWGTYRPDGLIDHNGELYVQCIIQGKGEVQYYLDNQPIDKDQIIGLKPSAPRDPNKPSVIRIKLSTISSIN